MQRPSRKTRTATPPAARAAALLAGAVVAGTAVMDRRVVAGAATGVAAAVGEASARGRLLQSGLTRTYALYMLAGAGLVIAAMLVGGAL